MSKINKLDTIQDKVLAARSMKEIASLKPELIRKPLIKVDTGKNQLSVRDKAIRKIMPKAMDLISSKKEKDMLLQRVLDMIEKAQKMGPKATMLHAQLWAVYATIQVQHVEDDHWSKNDLPQPWSKPTSLTALAFGNTVYLLEKELVEVAATDWQGESGDDTHGYQFTGGIMAGSDQCDNLDGYWSKAHQQGTEPELWRNEYQTIDTALPNKAALVGPRLPAEPCKQSVSPMPTGKPWSDLTWTPEIELLGQRQGSGLPFNPVAVDLKPSKAIDKAFGYGKTDHNPMEKVPHDSEAERADTLAWLEAKATQYHLACLPRNWTFHYAG